MRLKDQAVCCGTLIGPDFGSGRELSVGNDCRHPGSNLFRPGKTFTNPGVRLAWGTSFTVKEIEVFELVH
jgi:hypothetical protein